MSSTVECKDGFCPMPGAKPLKDEFDLVNRPKHYANRQFEVIEVIEDAIETAPDKRSAYLYGQMLKYTLRIFTKSSPLQDIKKSHWYAQRLTSYLEDKGLAQTGMAAVVQAMGASASGSGGDAAIVSAGSNRPAPVEFFSKVE